MTEFTIRDDHALANRGFGFAVATDLCRHCGKALGEHFGATLACNEADATKVTFIGAEAGKCIAYQILYLTYPEGKSIIPPYRSDRNVLPFSRPFPRRSRSDCVC
jgi:hypothetical protein